MSPHPSASPSADAGEAPDASSAPGHRPRLPDVPSGTPVAAAFRGRRRSWALRSALVGGLAVAAALSAACAPVEAGAAIVTNNQRISTADLSGLADQITSDATKIGALQDGELANGETPTVAAVTIDSARLVWDQVAADEHITVTQADIDAARTQFAQAAGIDPAQLSPSVLASIGYPLADTDAFLRVFVIEQKTLEAHNLPAADLLTSDVPADAEAVLTAAQATARQEIGLTVSPRYTGQQDYLATPASASAPS